MRILILYFALMATASAQSGVERANAAAAVVVGKPAQAWELPTANGGTLNLASYLGKQPIYLKFWATWCTPCREQMPHFQQVHATSGKGLAVIGINAGLNDTADSVRQFNEEHGLSMPMVIDDGRAAEALQLKVTPQHVVIDRAGVVRFIGHLVDERLEAALTTVTSSSAKPGAAVVGPAQKVVKYAVGDHVGTVELRALGASEPLRLDAPPRARPTVLAFVSAWCESYLADSRPAMAARCKRSREQLIAAASQLGAELNWVWIASSIFTSEERLRGFGKSAGIAGPLVLDDATLFNAFDIKEVPVVVLVDAGGVIRERLGGDEADLLLRLQRFADVATN